MEQDITPKIWEAIQREFWNNLKTDRLDKKLKDGKAGYKDADAYADIVGEAMAKAFHDNAVNLPNERMYYNIANRLISGSLEQSHDLVANYTANVQTALNKQAGLGIKGQQIEINEKMVENLVEAACQAEHYTDVASKVEQALKSYTRVVVSETLRENVALHHSLGLGPRIVRKLGAGSGRKRSNSRCDFCRERVGTWEYNKDTIDKEIFRRHANCKCTLEYFPQKGSKAEKVRAWESMEAKEDTAEYKELTKVLGKGNLNISLSKFHDMKYNNTREYRELKERAEWLQAEFPSEKSLNGHFESHGKEFGDISKEIYHKKASELLSSPISKDILGYDTETRRVRYDKKNNIYALGNPKTKRITTVFRPKEGREYYDKEVRKDLDY